MTVITETHGRVLVVRIEREGKRNAIDDETALLLDGAFNRLDDDEDLWAGVLTGTGTVFSAGTDLHSGTSPTTQRGGEYGLIRRRRSTPLIAAVEGFALGGGMELALACDIIVAARTASFGLPETRRGLVASSGALLRAAYSLPPHVATDLLITGSHLTAERAYELGLVSRICEPGQALDTALAAAQEVCECSPLAVRTTLETLRQLRSEAERQGWVASDRAAERIASSHDRIEGVQAFLEKRAPRWTGE